MNTDIEIVGDWAHDQQPGGGWMRLADIRVLHIVGEHLIGSIGLDTDNVSAPGILLASGDLVHLEAELKALMLLDEEAED